MQEALSQMREHEQFTILRRSPEAFLPMPLSGFRGFGCSLEPMRIGVNAEFVPVGLGKVYAIMLRGLFNVSRRSSPIFVRDIEHLIETGNSIAHVLCVGHRLFALLGKSEHGLGQVASRCVVPGALEWLPRCLDS